MKLFHGLIPIVLMAGAMACIGNPNGVSLSMPPERIDMARANAFCQEAPACKIMNQSILYLTDQGLAVTVTQNQVNIEIPINERGEPLFEYSDWQGIYEEELTRLSMEKALNLSSEDIYEISSSQALTPGSIVYYSPGEVGIADSTVSQARIAIADTYESQKYCSGSPVTVTQLPETGQTKGDTGIKMPDILPFMEIQQAPASQAGETKQKTGNSQTQPSFYPLMSYWWVILIILSIILLVFKLQMGGKEEEMTPQDLMALSAPRRIEMLRSLTERNKTLTELSKEEDISLPTAKEHLEKLEKSGLVKKNDTGHKWKYYELTRKGKRILNSTEFKNN